MHMQIMTELFDLYKQNRGFMSKIDIEQIIAISIKAGEAIIKIYDEDFEVFEKDDKSPLTEADKLSNEIIVSRLKEVYPEIPIISEESREVQYEDRKNWDLCWLVDPLDGTKEFIKKNGEFTVNIALLKDGYPLLGVIYVPVTDIVYYGNHNGSFRREADGSNTRISVMKPASSRSIIIAGSRSHPSAEMEAYLDCKMQAFDEMEFIAAGSSLKFCLVAEGKAHEYPRLGPTMEWDTGAGQAVLEGAGGIVISVETNDRLDYNKENLLNPFFIAKAG